MIFCPDEDKFAQAQARHCWPVMERFSRADADDLYQVGALMIELFALLRVAILVACSVRGEGWKGIASLCSKYSSLVAEWTAKRQLNQHAVEQLDQLRCKMTHRVWHVMFLFVIVRLVLGQFSEAWGSQRPFPEFDYNMLFYGAVGLLLKFKPGLINPTSLDAWYVGTSLILNLTLLPAALVEVNIVLLLTFPWRFLYAVLAKRTWCCVLCTLINVLQILWMSRVQMGEEYTWGSNAVENSLTLTVSCFMFFGIFLARGLLAEIAILKDNLHGRTVELGAVSSLLTACYDAVLEAQTIVFQQR